MPAAPLSALESGLDSALSWSVPQGQLLNIEQPDLGALFYCSPLPMADGQSVRGGVPVLFPQFAERGHLPKHGLVRQLQWHRPAFDQSSVQLEAMPSLGWHGQADLVLHVERLASDTVTLTLRITNTGTTAFSFTGGLHPYFLVQDVQACRISGLDGYAYQDRYAAQDGLSECGWMASAQAFERLYLQAPDLILDDGQRRLQLSCQGFTQWMIWNCGQAGAQTLPDLPDADWRRFLCIEPVVVAEPVWLAPQAVFEGSLMIRDIG